MALNRVDLPQPEGPTIAIVSRGASSKEMSRKASTAPGMPGLNTMPALRASRTATASGLMKGGGTDVTRRRPGPHLDLRREPAEYGVVEIVRPGHGVEMPAGRQDGEVAARNAVMHVERHVRRRQVVVV